MPAVLLFLVSGWVADRFDRRRVTALFLLGRVGCAVALVVYSQIEPGTLAPLFVIAFVFGAVDAMISPRPPLDRPADRRSGRLPARRRALDRDVHRRRRSSVRSLGGFLYSIGPSTAYAIAAVLEFAAIVPILMITYRREQDKLTERPTLSKALEGLHFVRRTPVVLATISLDLFAVLFGGAIALIPAVAEEQLHVGDIAYGWLRAAPGIGAAADGGLAGRTPDAPAGRADPARRRRRSSGSAPSVFGLTSSYAVAFLALVVISAADMISMYIRGSIVPLVTPDDQLGRVTAVEGVFIGASNELGAFESGVAARAFGLPWAIAGGGFITLAIAGVFAVVFPSLRNIDTFDELRPEPTSVAA